jgi:ferredoxin-NADP reductase
MIFYQELAKIAAEHPLIKVIYTITKQKNSWKGESGKISEKLIKKYVGDLQKPTYYIVGSSSMVDEAKTILSRMGILEDRIKTENFTGY